jgi:hypothetical protein
MSHDALLSMLASAQWKIGGRYARSVYSDESIQESSRAWRELRTRLYSIPDQISAAVQVEREAILAMVEGEVTSAGSMETSGVFELHHLAAAIRSRAGVPK